MKQLMLIHGAIGGADQMVPLRELLIDDFEIHLLEFDGHGRSAEHGEPFTLQSFNDQLDEALNNVGHPTHIFGYSMGGFIALLNLAHGNKHIASVSTLGTKMDWNEDIAIKETKHLNPIAIAEKVPKFAETLEKRHGVYWPDVLNRTAAFMKVLGKSQPVQESVMKKVNVPVQLCLAENDSMVSMEETQMVHNWISGSMLQVIPNSKHPIEQVDLIALSNTIRSFVHSVG